jgi:NAD(P)-dependent dehydrogenase (short-subunit alcohol dehydrogenase family)
VTRASYLILGATGAIGLVLCERLAKRGASLVLGGRSPEKLRKLAAATGGEAFAADGRDAAAVERAVAHAVERHGRLHGAVNLTGSVLFEAADFSDWEAGNERVAASLSSAFHLVEYAAKAMRGEGGSIVLVSPTPSTYAGAGHEAVAAAQASVEWLTRRATANFAAQCVRVNCVAPGLLGTPTRPDAWEVLHPLGCSSDPEDVAAAIAWLLEPVNSQVSGQVVRVDGGLALLHGGGRA